MALRTEVVQHAFECDGCGTIVKAESHEPKDMPTGYHVHMRRVTAAHKHKVSGPLFFCSKDCLVNAMQFQISHLTHDTEV